jgi:hypothetical protein
LQHALRNVTLLLGRGTRTVPHAKVKVPARDFHVDERSKEVIIDIPHTTEDADSSIMPTPT